MKQDYFREKYHFDITFPFNHWNAKCVSFPRHWHDFFEIIFVIEGVMYVSIEENVWEASNGDLLMINAGDIHGILEPRPGTKYYGFQFDITMFDENFVSFRDIIFQNPLLRGKSAKASVCERLWLLLREMAREYDEKAIGYKFAIKSKLYELMLVILRERTSQPHPKPISPKLERVLSYVLKNADDPDLTLEMAADGLNLNKFYFAHFFKKNTGQSFHSYLVKTRVNFAKNHLIGSELPIVDIAFQSGFNSLQTFNRVFKSKTGSTPGDYRRKNSILPMTHFE